ncbi:hypothetical protein CEXT_57721 [Caerostris extrusa]|uniref:Uncharacterized protein n=1 Tax=Caerostris extrusa TaxID=172846 RepID=A0AAV4XH40_CAEEX|nr:hypothetical protein CEXT_57721 [Caerostris extrusa]
MPHPRTGAGINPNIVRNWPVENRDSKIHCNRISHTTQKQKDPAKENRAKRKGDVEINKKWRQNKNVGREELGSDSNLFGAENRRL